MNEILSRDGMPSRFASLIFVHLSSTSGAVRYINAGHMPPLLLKSTGVQEMEKGEPALGLAPSTTYTEHELQLSLGDTLLLYSDGIIEAQNVQGEFFGSERFKALCRSLAGSTPNAVGERITILKSIPSDKNSQTWKDEDCETWVEKWGIGPMMFYKIDPRKL